MEDLKSFLPLFLKVHKLKTDLHHIINSSDSMQDVNTAENELSTLIFEKLTIFNALKELQ